MKTYHKFMEYFWLVVAVLTTVYAIFTVKSAGWENTENILLLMPAVSLGLYFMRRWHNRRKSKLEKQL